MYPSIKRIMSVCNVDRKTAVNIRLLMETQGSSLRTERHMAKIDRLLGNFGVEALSDNNFTGYWMDTGAIYSNTGDSYAGTIIYDTRSDRWYAESWADYVSRPMNKKRFE